MVCIAVRRRCPKKMQATLFTGTFLLIDSAAATVPSSQELSDDKAWSLQLRTFTCEICMRCSGFRYCWTFISQRLTVTLSSSSVVTTLAIWPPSFIMTSSPTLNGLGQYETTIHCSEEHNYPYHRSDPQEVHFCRHMSFPPSAYLWEFWTILMKKQLWVNLRQAEK